MGSGEWCWLLWVVVGGVCGVGGGGVGGGGDSGR